MSELGVGRERERERRKWRIPCSSYIVFVSDLGDWLLSPLGAYHLYERNVTYYQIVKSVISDRIIMTIL